MPYNSISRRTILKGSLAASALSFSGSQVRAEPNWKKFAGTTIEVSLAKDPRADILQTYEKEFTELTGINVNSEQVPEQQHRQKRVIEFASGKPSFDVFFTSYQVQKRQFDKAKWFTDLSVFMRDPTLTSPDFVESDFSAAGLQYAKDSDGALRSVPNSLDYWIIYWNKEIFAKKGISYPNTFDELVAASEQLTDAKDGTFGFVARGLRNANVPVWASFVLGYGGEFTDKDGKILSDSPESIEAAKLYQRLLSKSAPPGTAGYNWAECQSLFMQGKAAMWLDGVGFAPPLENPEKSRVAGKVGYGVMPRGPKAQACATYGSGYGVPAASTKKEAAYLYCQWAVSKKMGTRILQSGSGVPVRNSVLNDPEVRKGVKMPSEWINAVIGSAKISKLGMPVVIPVSEYRDIIGAGLTATLSGADPAVEMKKATDQFRPILERSEKT